MNLPDPMDAPDASEILARLAAEQREWEERANASQGKAAQAFARLVETALHGNSGQAQKIAQFVAATYNGSAYRFDPFDLRTVDVAISDDMLQCLDALRWGKLDLYHLVPGGEAAVREVIKIWSIASDR